MKDIKKISRDLVEKMIKENISEVEIQDNTGTLKIKIKTSELPPTPQPLTQIPTSKEQIEIIKSPEVGFFHSLAKVGDEIKKGQKIGEVFCLKVPVEILSPVNGIVKEILKKDGNPVGCGEGLFRIEAYE